MKVRDLIAKLQEYDGDLPVTVLSQTDETACPFVMEADDVTVEFGGIQSADWWSIDMHVRLGWRGTRRLKPREG